MISEEFEIIIDSLKSKNINQIKRSINQVIDRNSSDLFSSSEYKDYKEKIEEHYYLTLSKYLASMQFKKFRKLFNYSNKLEIFIDVKKIPSRFDIICELHLDGIQTGQTGRIFDIIRFYNEYNLFERYFIKEEEELIEELKKDKILLDNLKDLFGKVSKSLIYYSCKIIPYDLYLMFSNYYNSARFTEDNFFMRDYFNLSFLLRYFNRYAIYGLSVENLGTVEGFFKKFQKVYAEKMAKAKVDGKESDLKFIEFTFRRKKHLVSPENLMKIKNKVLAKDHYKFYSLSMVFLGGLGPQGHGFTYSTPKGEVIEICSDIRENDAIIVKYKQFLKQQFLTKLENKLKNSAINGEVSQKIINYLNEELNPSDLINYFKKDGVLRQIIKFLTENETSSINYNEFFDDSTIFELIKTISDSISNILRKIKLDDQFKTRMDLIDEKRVRSEDIAKLTSLKGKSHYDVLRERYFFQNEINWFYKDYSEKLLNSANGL